MQPSLQPKPIVYQVYSVGRCEGKRHQTHGYLTVKLKLYPIKVCNQNLYLRFDNDRGFSDVCTMFQLRTQTVCDIELGLGMSEWRPWYDRSGLVEYLLRQIALRALKYLFLNLDSRLR